MLKHALEKIVRKPQAQVTDQHQPTTRTFPAMRYRIFTVEARAKCPCNRRRHEFFTLAAHL